MFENRRRFEAIIKRLDTESFTEEEVEG